MEIFYNLASFLFALLFRPLIALITNLLELLLSLTSNYGVTIFLMSLSLYFIQKIIVKVVNRTLNRNNSNESYVLKKAESIKKIFVGYERHLLLKELYRQQKYGLLNRIKAEIPAFIPGLGGFNLACSIVVNGPHQERSIRHLESLRKTQKKTIYLCGCSYYDYLRAEISNIKIPPKKEPHIIIAPMK